MVKALDFHMVNSDLSPRPGGLKFTPDTCVCMPKIPRGEWRRRDYSVAMAPGCGGVMSHFLSLGLPQCL